MNSYQSVTQAEFDAFVLSYFKNAFPDQRLGQAFCNFFHKHDPELFYETDRNDAKIIIKQRYLNQNA